MTGWRAASPDGPSSSGSVGPAQRSSPAARRCGVARTARRPGRFPRPRWATSASTAGNPRPGARRSTSTRRCPPVTGTAEGCRSASCCTAPRRPLYRSADALIGPSAGRAAIGALEPPVAPACSIPIGRLRWLRVRAVSDRRRPTGSEAVRPRRGDRRRAALGAQRPRRPAGDGARRDPGVVPGAGVRHRANGAVGLVDGRVRRSAVRRDVSRVRSGGGGVLAGLRPG